MRSGRYTGIITSLLLLTALLLFFSDPWGTFRRNQERILLTEADRVDRITLTDGRDSVELVRAEGTWMISGKERANQVAVENILFAAGHLETRSVLAEEDLPDNVQESRVEFYQGDRLLLSYDLVEGGGQLILKERGGDRLLLVSVTGYADSDPGRIFVSSPGHYRERLLIDLMPSDISLIGIELPGRDTFRFTQDPAGDIRCYRSGQAIPLPGEDLDELSIRLLFSYFTDIIFDRMSGVPASELLTTGEGILARLSVESHQGEKHSLTVFPYPGEAGTPHMFLALVVHNNAAEAMVVNYIFLDVLMRDLSHYLAGSERGPDSPVQ